MAGLFHFWRLDLLSANRLLSAADTAHVLGISGEGLRQMRKRGAAPPAMRVGAVNATLVDCLIDRLAAQLCRAQRPKWMRRLAS